MRNHTVSDAKLDEFGRAGGREQGRDREIARFRLTQRRNGALSGAGLDQKHEL